MRTIVCMTLTAVSLVLALNFTACKGSEESAGQDQLEKRPSQSGSEIIPNYVKKAEVTHSIAPNKDKQSVEIEVTVGLIEEQSRGILKVVQANANATVLTDIRVDIYNINAEELALAQSDFTKFATKSTVLESKQADENGKVKFSITRPRFSQFFLMTAKSKHDTSPFSLRAKGQFPNAYYADIGLSVKRPPAPFFKDNFQNTFSANECKTAPSKCPKFSNEEVLFPRLQEKPAVMKLDAIGNLYLVFSNARVYKRDRISRKWEVYVGEPDTQITYTSSRYKFDDSGYGAGIFSGRDSSGTVHPFVGHFDPVLGWSPLVKFDIGGRAISDFTLFSRLKVLFIYLKQNDNSIYARTFSENKVSQESTAHPNLAAMGEAQLFGTHDQAILYLARLGSDKIYQYILFRNNSWSAPVNITDTNSAPIESIQARVHQNGNAHLAIEFSATNAGNPFNISVASHQVGSTPTFSGLANSYKALQSFADALGGGVVAQSSGDKLAIYQKSSPFGSSLETTEINTQPDNGKNFAIQGDSKGNIFILAPTGDPAVTDPRGEFKVVLKLFSQEFTPNSPVRISFDILNGAAFGDSLLFAVSQSGQIVVVRSEVITTRLSLTEWGFR